MTDRQSAHRAGRRTRRAVCAVLVAIGVAMIGFFGYQSLVVSAAMPALDVPPGGGDGPLGPADGVVPDGVTVFDDEVPAVANLDPHLLHALRQSAIDASDDGIEFVVNSGWRSQRYQEHLLDDAVEEYGSHAEASRWVATPAASAHVSGDAVDIGDAAAIQWLVENGAAYGLCQVYDNEPWHFELSPRAVFAGCPPTYADPSEDPRLQP